MNDFRLTFEDTGILVGLYEEQDLSVDNLPYTQNIERIYLQYNKKAETTLTKSELWKTLINLRKASKLPKKRKINGN